MATRHLTRKTAVHVDSLTCRLGALSFAPQAGRRCYARARSKIPRISTSAISSDSSPSRSKPPSGASHSQSSKASNTSVEATAAELLKSFDSQAAQNIHLPFISNLKVPQVQQIESVQEYDPNMVIFLDKHGKATMIPHDDRVTGQTREEYEVSSISEASVTESMQAHQRGSKEMEYGRKRIGQVEMPIDIQDAIRAVLGDYDRSLIRTDALRLYGSLRSTGTLEGNDLVETQTKRMKSGSASIRRKDDKLVPAHILEYGHRESTAYIAAVAPTTYSAIVNVLEEVRRRLPALDPKSVLDFGTGPGTAIWAANDVWKTSIEYTGIDVSLDMLETGEKILAAMSANGKPIPNVAFKSFASHGSQAQKHDVVISAFALSELTTTALRRSTLEHLWDSTNDILILIDRGTPSGFKILAEAREQILGLDLDRLKPKPTYDTYGNLIPPEEPQRPEAGYVVAPCPHDKLCPMYASLSHDSQWCHFSQKVQRPDFLRKTKHTKENYEDSKYTYVVLRKGTRPVYMPPAQTLIPSDPPSIQSSDSHNTSDAPINETVKSSGGIDQKVAETNAGKKKKVKKQPPPPPVSYDNAEDMQAASHSWPRIVIPPLKRDGHVVMDTCAASGFLERIIIPKSQGKIPYRDARKAMWGDLFPHEPKNRPVRKDIVENVSDGQDSGSGAKPEDDIEGKKLKQRRGPLNTGGPGMLERMKHKEKKQSRQKVTLEADGSASSRKNRRRNEEDDIILEL